MQSASAAKTDVLRGHVYRRRTPETTALYGVLQQHLTTFEQQWTDPAAGRTLPTFVTEELGAFLFVTGGWLLSANELLLRRCPAARPNRCR